MIRSLSVAALILSATLPGCGSADRIALDCDFEQTGDSEAIPDDWRLNVLSGDYESAMTAQAVSGSAALAVAGADGSAELRSAACALTGNLVECEFWLQGQIFKKGELSAGVEIMTTAGQVLTRKVIPVHAQEDQWHRFHFCTALEQDYTACVAQLFLRLDGACLVRIDDVRLKSQKGGSEYQLTDGGFENASGSADNWQVRHGEGTAGIEIGEHKPFEGKSYLQLKGSSDWSVCMPDLEVPLKPGRRLLLQGVVRAAAGDGHLKLEYWKNGQFVDHFFSDIVKQNDWTFVSLDSSKIKQPDADTVRISLGAGSETKRFSADFDQISLYVID